MQTGREAADYLDFRKYALSGLSDLGFLDHLLRLFPGTLRVISGFGKPTGMLCVLVTAGARLRQRRRDRGRRRGRSAGPPANSGDGGSDSGDDGRDGFSEDDVRTSAYNFVSRLLRDGPVARVLESLRDEAAAAGEWR